MIVKKLKKDLQNRTFAHFTENHLNFMSSSYV